jgi:hypothetical protein
MKKAIIFASSLVQYRNFCRNFNLHPNDYIYASGLYSDLCGWWVDKPIILLEGYEYNRNYTCGVMNYVGHRFDNIGFISEGEIWNESIKL